LKSIRNIYLTWRKGKGSRRHIVGVLKKNASEGIRFEYLKENIHGALKDGFTPYTDFPDLNKNYTENVIDIFGQRIIQSERGDIQKYFDFWELDKKYVDDKYYMLAYTQGMLSTDNFEFLADFYPKMELCFVSEICGLTHLNLPANTVKIDDELAWVKESSNEFDNYAVKVYKDKIMVGYVKKVHNRVFYKNTKGRLRIFVKSVDQNGSINRIFVRISF
jgi:hypothetical protein